MEYFFKDKWTQLAFSRFWETSEEEEEEEEDPDMVKGTPQKKGDGKKGGKKGGKKWKNVTWHSSGITSIRPTL